MLSRKGSIFFEKTFVEFNKNCNFALTKKEQCSFFKDPVVQLVRMPPCHGGGRGFESRPDRKKTLQVFEGFFVFEKLMFI